MPVSEVDGIAGEIASQMSGNDGSTRGLFDRDDFGMKVVLTPHLLRPDADGAPSIDVAPFIAHDGVLGKARGDTIGIESLRTVGTAGNSAER
jgi:hypothetical protein